MTNANLVSMVVSGYQIFNHLNCLRHRYSFGSVGLSVNYSARVSSASTFRRVDLVYVTA